MNILLIGVIMFTACIAGLVLWGSVSNKVAGVMAGLAGKALYLIAMIFFLVFSILTFIPGLFAAMDYDSNA